MRLAQQPDSLPTNKAAVVALIAPAVNEIWPRVMADIYAPLAGDAVSMLVAGLFALAVAWFVPDRENI